MSPPATAAVPLRCGAAVAAHDTRHAPGNTLAPHGARVPRGADAPPTRGRFGKMFPGLSHQALSEDTISALLEVIDASASVGENSTIPAGFTYFGQFVDHDITYDATPQSQKLLDPHAATSFRTPRLDLDSLYGSGPRDQPFLYDSRPGKDEGVKLLVGATRPWNGRATLPDLPRNDQRRALIGDPRNDESIIIAQVHLLFIRFHNKVVDYLRAQCCGLSGTELFDEARRVVCWHYQWIVVHDLLRRYVGEELLKSVLRAGETFTSEEDVPFIPVEFSGAAYRFGHSMVRDSYNVNAGRRGVPIFAEEDNPSELAHLGGFRRLPRGLVIDWSFFFESTTRRPQSSLAIDTYLAAPLRELPVNVDAERNSLALLNLRRASMLDLPTGQAVADAMDEPRLDAAQLRLDEVRIASSELRGELLDATPLWYYVLREAAALTDGRRLGPVGGRIVAKTLVGLLLSDSQSYLAQDPGWRPELPGADGDFTMADLVRFTEGQTPAGVA